MFELVLPKRLMCVWLIGGIGVYTKLVTNESITTVTTPTLGSFIVRARSNLASRVPADRIYLACAGEL